MNESVLNLGAAPGERVAAVPVVRNPKLDQWICYWSIPFFYVLFGLIFVLLARIMPPQSPTSSAADIVAYMQSPTLRWGIALLALTLGLASMASGIIVVQMQRMKGLSAALPYSYLAALAVAGVPGCLFPCFVFALGGLRPEYSPEIQVMLYDLGFLSFVGSLGVFTIQYLVFAIAIFLDERQIFPKWLGYLTIWALVTEIVAVPVWVTRTGPFAWDGLLSFWLGTAIFVGWEFLMCVCLYRAIKNQPIEELEHHGG
ncbi:MAG: hypothetical protein OXT09_22235 [Myxococcales bacterium]|nr:hypothetical protein [Myxococcales bacterium]